MPRQFRHLTRPAIRALKPGEKITEGGIMAAKLDDGDVRYSVNVMVDGQRIHRVIGLASDGTTRTQAEEFIAKTRSDAAVGRLELPRGRKLHHTFGAAADLYLKRLEEIGGKDFTKNEQHLRLHLKPYLGNMRLDKISTFTLQKFQRHCRDKGLSETTTNRVLATYRRMARRLYQWKVVATPMPMVKLSKERNVRDFVISADEERRLLDAALKDSNSYVSLFIRLGLATGLRHSEMLSAQFDGFDHGRRRLRVRAKGGRMRNQPLTKGITELLGRERDMAADRDGWIFPSTRSRTGHMEQMSEAFARCVERAEMDPKRVTPHTMRHTAITRLAATGADFKTLQEFSGHESLAMVLRYAHAQDKVIDRALDLLEERTTAELPQVQKAEKS